MECGTWIVDLYSFFNATKATIRGGLGGQLKIIFEKKSRGGVASWRFVIYQRF
jgi:hypothetical protein